VAHVTLPNLDLLSFRGASAYLEGLLARISAPLLNTLEVLFFNQLTFTIPRLSQFMQTSEDLTFDAVEIAFDRDFVDLKVDPYREGWKQPLRLRIMCRHLDWQVASAVQILHTLSPVLSDVGRVTLSHAQHNRSSEWHNEVDYAQWRDLLRPFIGVKTLRVHNELVGGVAHSLRSEDGETPLELLPNLEELTHTRGDIGDSFTAFISERKEAGHPVRLERVFDGDESSITGNVAASGQSDGIVL
jgi:hypothetical protein